MAIATAQVPASTSGDQIPDSLDGATRAITDPTWLKVVVSEFTKRNSKRTKAFKNLPAGTHCRTTGLLSLRTAAILGDPGLTITGRVPDQYFLLGVDADRRIPGAEVVRGLIFEVAELGIVVRMLHQFERPSPRPRPIPANQLGGVIDLAGRPDMTDMGVPGSDDSHDETTYWMPRPNI